MRPRSTRPMRVDEYSCHYCMSPTLRRMSPTLTSFTHLYLRILTEYSVPLLEDIDGKEMT